MIIKTINAIQIREITAKGITYTDDDDTQGFVDFEFYHIRLYNLFLHPNVKAMNRKSRFAKEYEALINNLEMLPVVGLVGNNAHTIDFVDEDVPICLEFDTYQEFLLIRDVIHAFGWKLVYSFFQVF